jgi:hypothetical protein
MGLCRGVYWGCVSGVCLGGVVRVVAHVGVCWLCEQGVIGTHSYIYIYIYINIYIDIYTKPSRSSCIPFAEPARKEVFKERL